MANHDLITLVLDSLIDQGQMERFFALSANSNDETCVAARAHALLVTSLSLNEVAQDHIRRGIVNETETLAYATLAMLHKLTGEIMDVVRAAELRDDLPVISHIVVRCRSEAASLEQACTAQCQRIFALCDDDGDEEATFAAILADSRRALTQARLLRTVASELKRE